MLETSRLYLRKFKIDDAETMFNGWCNDPEVSKYMTWNPHQNVEETKSLLSFWIDEYKNPNSIRYGICLKETNELIGSIDVVDYIDNNPFVGYCLSKKHWNNGYMTEALKALIDELFNKGFEKIVISADVRNIGSNRVIEKCGFKFTHKEFMEHCSRFKPEPVTVNWYELVK